MCYNFLLRKQYYKPHSHLRVAYYLHDILVKETRITSCVCVQFVFLTTLVQQEYSTW